MDLPAVAAGGAAADLTRLQEHHIHPRLRQMQSGGESGEAAAHHHHIGACVGSRGGNTGATPAVAAYQEGGCAPAAVMGSYVQQQIFPFPGGDHPMKVSNSARFTAA